MRMIPLLALGLLIFTATSAHAADLYVCKQPNGVKAYQDKPCANSQAQISHDTYTPHVYAPPAPTPPSDAAAAQSATPSAPPPWQATYGTSSSNNAAPDGDTSCQGIGCTAQQRGQVHTRECVAPSGRAYYTTAECKTRVNVVGQQPRDWQRDHVQGVPGAIMTGPDTALDPNTGRVIYLQHAPDHTPVYQRTQDAGARIAPADACQLARQDANAHPRDHAAARRAHNVCSKGRGLWDQAPPDRGIQ